MDLQLKGKTVFIAGASRGIGLGMARAFAKEGEGGADRTRRSLA